MATTSASSPNAGEIGGTVPAMDDIDDRIESAHAGTCSVCYAYPVPTKGGLCPSCRRVVESPAADGCCIPGSVR